jgi:hypothetical protein
MPIVFGSIPSACAIASGALGFFVLNASSAGALREDGRAIARFRQAHALFLFPRLRPARAVERDRVGQHRRVAVRLRRRRVAVHQPDRRADRLGRVLVIREQPFEFPAAAVAVPVGRTVGARGRHD